MDKRAVKNDLKKIYPANALRIAITICFSILEAITVSVVSVFINNTVEGLANGTLSLLSADYLLTFGLILASGICVAVFEFSKCRVCEKAGILFRTILFNKSMSQYSIVKSLKAGYTFSMLCECFTLAENTMERKIMLISSTVKILVVGAFMAYYSVFALAYVFVFFGLFTLANHFLNIKTQKSIAAYFKSTAQYKQFFLQGLKGSRELTFLKREEYYASKYDEKIAVMKKARDNLNFIGGIQNGAHNVLNSMVSFGAAIISVIFFAVFDMPMYAVLSVFLLASNIIDPLNVYTYIISEYTKDRERVKVAEENFYREESKSGEKELSKPLAEIKMNIASFSYGEVAEGEDKTETKLLANLSEKVEAGEFVVVRGESGCGKSTLLKLIGGSEKLKETDGEILFNGEKSETISIRSLNKCLARVRQKSVIFEDTFFNNLCLGENFSSKEIASVISTACLQDFEKEYGLSLELSENGGNISEGQKQRICIARALLRKPNFLLLDEPTSALDKVTADSLMANLKEFAKKNNTAIIMISHKASEASFADKIIEIKK